MATLNFLTPKGEALEFSQFQMDIYLPKEYFDSEIASYLGNKVNTTGIFQFKVFKDKEDKKGRMYQMSLPESIIFEFNDSVEEMLTMGKNKDPEKYIIFSLKKGNLFMETTQLTQFFANTENLVKMHHNGKLPDILAYHEILNMYIDSMRNNSSSLRMPLALIEMIISGLARDKNNLDVPFRKVIGAGKAGENDYLQMSIKNLAMTNSTFTAITSEDINKAIINSVNKSEYDGVERETPIEKTFKY